MAAPMRAIIAVNLSAWWINAEVAETTCGHKHMRPIGRYRVGDTLLCPFCDSKSFPFTDALVMFDTDTTRH